MSVMNEAEKAEYIRKIRHLQGCPEDFLEKILGEETLEDYHRVICKLVVEFERLAIKACHAVGKTWIMGRIVLWFLMCFKSSIVITTAPTNRQVETLLWGEIRKAHKRSKTRLGGKLLTKKLVLDDDWYAMGFSPKGSGTGSESGEQEGSSFQGFHAKHVLIIFDEATGVPHDLYVMAEGLLTSGVTVKWICIANPTSTSSEFFNICKKAEWKVHTINCFDSPNMKANGFTNRQRLEEELGYLATLSDNERLKRIKNYAKPNGHLLSAQWAVAKLFEWGFEHPLAKSKVLGEFPTKQDDVIIKWDSMQAAINREPVYDYKKRFIGVDVARYGDDLTYITDITDYQFRGAYKSLKEEISETTGRVVKTFWAGDSGKETHIGIDCTGVGAGVYSDLKELKRTGSLPDYVFIHEVNFGEKLVSEDKEEQDELRKHYENVKALIYEKLNEDLRDHLIMPDEEIYQTETVNILFKYSKTGTLLVESKDDYKKRTKKSPDATDSLAIANYLRYLKPTYGKFKGKEVGTLEKTFAKEFAKKKLGKKSGIKISTY